MSEVRKISLIGGLILATLTVISGISVYVVMQRQTESILSRAFESSLQNNVHLFDDQIQNEIARTRAVAGRPFVIQNLKLLEKNPNNARGLLDLKRVAQSLLPTGFNGVNFYDVNGAEVGRAGDFSPNPDLRISLNTENRTYLMWAGQFVIRNSVDVLDQEGRRIGTIMSEANLPKLTRAIANVASIGKTVELAVCAPLEDDMQCFPLTVSNKVLKRLPRTMEGKALPMSYALDGKTGIIFAQDYRREQVVAAYAPIGMLGLGMVLKIDQAELYIPVREQSKYVIPLLGALIFAGMLLLYWLLTPLVRKLADSQREILGVNTLLRESEEKLRTILDSSPVAITWASEQGVIEYANHKFTELFGYTLEDVPTVEQWYLHACPDATYREKTVSTWEANVGMSRQGNTTIVPMELTIICKDGSVRHVILAGSRVGSCLLVTFSDITERKLLESELRVAAVSFESQESVIITDADGVILRVNQAFIDSTGYAAEEAVGKTPRLLKSGRHNAEFYRTMWETIHRTGSWRGEIWDRHKNGEIYPKWLTITAVKGADGTVTHYVGTHTDISERKAAEEKINLLAFYDPLTGLPNRRLLMDRFQQTLISSARSGREGALLFIDLDNFKTLNDTHGHDMGDLLLQQVAQRLTSCVREDDTVARLGGDEFVVVLKDMSVQELDAAAQTEAIAKKMLVILSQPYLLDFNEYQGTSSIGAVIFNGKSQTMDDLMKQADIAMYQAKKAGRHTLCFFDPQMQTTINVRAALEGELRKALENRQFHLYYQVLVDGSHHSFGAEALIRWIHPERGLISPLQFIPLAEETGLILPIGQWVVETACAQLKAWQQDVLTRDLELAVNISAKQFRQPDFVTQVQAAVQRHGINPMQLKLELTESLLLGNVEDTIVAMMVLKKIGVKLSLDDFGTGYSSLQYLKRLPLDQLKIDQSFVRDIAIDDDDKAIVRTIIAMAHSMGLNVIAEGVEMEGQRQLLLDMGCTHFQGYLFGRPVPIEQFESLLK